MSEVECPSCNKHFQSLGQHWRFNRTHIPRITPYQQEIIAGLLMGDGCIPQNPPTPYLVTNMINKKYLDWLDDNFGILSMGVKRTRTSREQAVEMKKTGFNEDAKEDNCSDVYTWRMRCHPELSTFNNWYGESKIFPSNIPLSPTVLKHWYVSDGHYNNRGYQNSIQISMSNERKNKNKIEDMFMRTGLPKPDRWDENKRKSGGYRCSAIWNVENTKFLLQYMGNPLPGFEYKFQS